MCTQPIPAWFCYDYDETDGQVIFSSKVPNSFNVCIPMELPCGHCLECTLKNRRDWTTRALCEFQSWDRTAFITLTYNEENLPENGDLRRSDWKKFADKLRAYVKRKYKIDKIVLFGCGEYGCNPEDPVKTPAGRPHFHCCVFGFDFPDKYAWSRSGTGFVTYRSPFLESIWTSGHSVVQSLEYGDLAYCAGYVEKKALKRLSAEQKYGNSNYFGRQRYFYDQFGCVHPAEFRITPCRPALGRHWIEKFFKDAYPSGFIVINDQKYSVPKYFDKYCKEKDLDMYLRVRKERLKKMYERSAENTPERRATREELLRLKFEKTRKQL